jgi:hypothetical protein
LDDLVQDSGRAEVFLREGPLGKVGVPLLPPFHELRQVDPVFHELEHIGSARLGFRVKMLQMASLENRFRGKGRGYRSYL